MRYLKLFALLLLFVPFTASADPSTEERMQFTTSQGRSCSGIQKGEGCNLTIAIAETERSTGIISFATGGIICVNGDTASSTAAAPIALVWQQAVNSNTLNGSIPVTASTAVLVGGVDCWGVVGSGYLEFGSAPLTEVKISIRGQ